MQCILSGINPSIGYNASLLFTLSVQSFNLSAYHLVSYLVILKLNPCPSSFSFLEKEAKPDEAEGPLNGMINDRR